MVKIFNEIKKMDECSVIFEPELFIAMTFKHVNRKFPNCILFLTGSFNFLWGQIENLKVIYKLVKYLVINNTKSL